MAIPYQKEALTFEEQLELLVKRGLIVSDKQHALSQLSSISYYRLSAYWHPFMEHDESGQLSNNFLEGSSFTDVIKLYEFDRELRLLMVLRRLVWSLRGHTQAATIK